jgi:MFS family permease
MHFPPNVISSLLCLFPSFLYTSQERYPFNVTLKKTNIAFYSGIVYLPGATVNNFWQLVIIRFALGVLIGGVIPSRIAYIRQEAPVAMQGEVLGYNTSL